MRPLPSLLLSRRPQLGPQALRRRRGDGETVVLGPAGEDHAVDRARPLRRLPALQDVTQDPRRLSRQGIAVAAAAIVDAANRLARLQLDLDAVHELRLVAVAADL